MASNVQREDAGPSMPNLGTAMYLLRQRGQRLGQVSLVRPRKVKAQSWQNAGSIMNRRVRSLASVRTTCVRWSSISRSGTARRSANWRVDRRVPVKLSTNRCRTVLAMRKSVDSITALPQVSAASQR